MLAAASKRNIRAAGLEASSRRKKRFKSRKAHLQHLFTLMITKPFIFVFLIASFVIFWEEKRLNEFHAALLESWPLIFRILEIELLVVLGDKRYKDVKAKTIQLRRAMANIWKPYLRWVFDNETLLNAAENHSVAVFGRIEADPSNVFSVLMNHRKGFSLVVGFLHDSGVAYVPTDLAFVVWRYSLSDVLGIISNHPLNLDPTLGIHFLGLSGICASALDPVVSHPSGVLNPLLFLSQSPTNTVKAWCQNAQDYTNEYSVVRMLRTAAFYRTEKKTCKNTNQRDLAKRFETQVEAMKDALKFTERYKDATARRWAVVLVLRKEEFRSLIKLRVRPEMNANATLVSFVSE